MKALGHIVVLRRFSTWNAQNIKFYHKNTWLSVCTCEDSWVPPPLHQALSSICLTTFAWLYIEIAIYISHLIFFTSHLFLSQQKSSFFFHHPSKTALSKVSNNPWIVRYNDFFSAFIWFQVYVSWLFWVLPVWNFAVHAITLRSSSSVDNLSETFTGSFWFIYLNLFLKSRCQDKVLFFCPHLSLHNTIFVRS